MTTTSSKQAAWFNRYQSATLSARQSAWCKAYDRKVAR